MDIYLASNWPQEVVVDTFTVFNPSDHYAITIDDFTFDKEQYKWIENKINRSLELVYGDPNWFMQIKGDKDIEIIDNSSVSKRTRPGYCPLHCRL